MKKIRVALVFGGRSAEHEVSIRSAKTVYKELDKQKYDIVPIAIDRSGKWLNDSSSLLLLEATTSKGAAPLTEISTPSILKNITSNFDRESTIDVVFPILHGPNGEDGSIQGLFKVINVPYVGPDVLGSSVCMDKDIAKRLLLQADIPCAPFVTVESRALDKVNAKEIFAQLGTPVFIKPANLGSSVGIGKAKNENELIGMLKNAAKFDKKILIEKFIKGREIECSVLGNEEPVASIPGEIIAGADFYSYDAKYSADSQSTTKIPAELPEKVTTELQSLAVKAFKVLGCEGMARVDFFLDEQNKLWINELNTIPGFTSISMYPKMWEASGLPISKLLDKLIDLAISRYNRDSKLQITV